MDQGYFKCWRKIIKSPIFKNEGLLKVWIWCLAKASYKERCVKFMTGRGGIEINILPGQFVFGRDSASLELDMNPSTIWKRIGKLKNIENLNIESNRQYSLITITNWSVYQQEVLESNSESNYQVTSKEQASNTNKNSNKEKNEKNKEYSIDFIEFWKSYPNRIGKDAAWGAWQKRNGDRPPVEQIIQAIKDQKEWRESARQGEFRPEWKNPSTWINQGCWNDETPKPERWFDD